MVWAAIIYSGYDQMTTLTSRSGALTFGPSRPLCLINDQLRVYDQSPLVLAQLKHGQFDALLALARLGQERGTHMVDILIGHHELDEVELLPKLALAVHDAIGQPISLDTRNPAALDAALTALHPYKAMINSVSAEAECLDSLLPIARKHGAAVVGMPTGSYSRLPRTVEERVAEALVILAACDRYGIPRDDVVLDAMCLATAAEPGSMAVALQTLRAFHESLDVSTILGVGNAGFGMPDPTRIDLAYLVAAVPHGLDAALVNPTTPGLPAAAQAISFLCGRDDDGRDYIHRYRAHRGDIIDLHDSIADGQLFRSHSDRSIVEAYIPSAGLENHAPNFARLANGDLLCTWFAGDREGMASVRPVLSRLPAGSPRWQAPTDILLDTSCSQQNPVLFAEPDGRLHAFFTAQQTRGCMLDEWQARVARGEAAGPFWQQGTAVIRQRSSDDGGRTWGPVRTPFDKPGSYCRQPMVVMSNGEWLFPMYYSPDDGSEHLNDYSVVQVSADRGLTWREYEMTGSQGLVQASVVEFATGELVAFMRSRSADRIYRSQSADYGRTWTAPQPTPLPNNNSSIQCCQLKSGRLAMVFNRCHARDARVVDRAVWPQERYPVTIALSADRGLTWPWQRDIDAGDGFRGDANRRLNRQDAYPCVTQTFDGFIHVAYSYRGRQCIKYVRFAEAWVGSSA